MAKQSDRAAAMNGELPPHSPQAELGVLACCMISPAMILEQCKGLRPEVFYDLRHRAIWVALRVMVEKRMAIDSITFVEYLKSRKQLEECGGREFIDALPDETPSAHNLPYWLGILRDKYAIRKTMQVCGEVIERARGFEGDVEEFLDGAQADLDTAGALFTEKERPALKIWRVSEIIKHEVDPRLRLVGDNEICMGYDGISVIAGPGSSGKSLMVATLAMAGARGDGTWQGRAVHRQFKTLILQAENGTVRLKNQIEAMAKYHPELDFENNVFFSEPPEGGLPFHKADFRSAVREHVEKLGADLVVVDPWSQVAAQDDAKEVVDKITEIRSCFPAGDKCPGLMILAHTKKPRPEDVRNGRGLVYLVSGTIALTNTARSVYVLLPWTDDLEDDRVYWCCPKLNNGQMYGASVWHRRFGSFFVHDPITDPRTWGEEKPRSDDKKKIAQEDVIKAYEGLSVLRKSDLAKRLEKNIGAGYSTTMRAISKGGYLAGMFEEQEDGCLQLKREMAAPSANTEAML